MFADFLKRLTAPQTNPMADTDARRALGALLVRLAKVDGIYHFAEVALIDRILSQRYGLNPVEAAKLRAECEAIEHDAPDTVRFTRAIKDAVAFDDRIGVIEAMWQIVLADGMRDAGEDALMRMAAPLLGVSDQDSNMIRQSIEARKT
jgi:uncharacterized tellurite resistance protein B-like protein